MKIDLSTDGFEINAKRLYLPCKVQDECPKCKKPAELDLEKRYLSYPTANGTQWIYFGCSDCDEEWERAIRLKILVEEVGCATCEGYGRVACDRIASYGAPCPDC